MADKSLRFDDDALQRRFLSELSKKGVSFRRAPDGAVECSDAEWGAVNDAAHAVRDACFRWYFCWCDTPADAEAFLRALRRSTLPFQLEHHRDRMVFLLDKQHQDRYHELGDEAFG